MPISCFGSKPETSRRFSIWWRNIAGRWSALCTAWRITPLRRKIWRRKFLRVYRSREGYEPSAKFTTWLYRIATNLAVNHARDTRNERPDKTVSLDEPDQETGQTMDVPDASLTAEQSIMRRERLAAIRKK